MSNLPIYNFTILQGQTTSFYMIWTNDSDAPVNLTGYTAKMQMRRTYDSATADFTFTHTSGITLTPLSGRIDILISDTQTSSMTDEYVYDLELTSPIGGVTRILQGEITINQEVTR